MSISEVLDSLHGSDGNLQVRVTEDWAQGRATFGGLMAAIGNQAMRTLVPAERPLRSLQTVFVGPAGPATWQITAKVLRVGKAVTLAQCEIRDGDQVTATQFGIYGTARSSNVHFKPQRVTPARAVDDINDVRYQHGRMPAFMQHFAVRWAEGGKPFSSSPKTPSKAFIRHRDTEPLGESKLIALVDCITTPALSMFSAPAPASSISWTLEFFEHDLDFASDAWWRIDSDVDAATDGYVNQTSVLNDPNGRPVALSRQLFAIFN